METKIPLLVITGPTASGKTALSVELAKLYDGEIVSADSMQIYKGMDIATAKPTVEEMQGVPHHLMSVIERDQSFSVADYVAAAKSIIADISARGRLPILVGGTGLYINSLVDNIAFTEHKADPALRERLTRDYEALGGKVMLERLRTIDPAYAEKLHPNNSTRIIRGIEIFEQTGVRMSEHVKNSRSNPSPYNLCMLGLTFKVRQDLYDRIDRRVDSMLENGLLDEAKQIYAEQCEKGLKTAAQAIGIKELIPYFEGKTSLSECVETIKRESRRYAKRQLTWFRRDARIQWIESDADVTPENLMTDSQKRIEKSCLM